jgi:putative Mn2+ efflux pump MntP
MSLELVITSALLGVGLAMDAFSVSLANGLADRDMKIGRMLTIAGTFVAFQFAMPMIGWVFVHTAESRLEWFSSLVPWIALLLLLYIGGKMLKEGIEDGDLTTQKTYLKGQANDYAAPLVKELPKHSDAANRTAGTILDIIVKLGKPPAEDNGLELDLDV